MANSTSYGAAFDDRDYAKSAACKADETDDRPTFTREPHPLVADLIEVNNFFAILADQIEAEADYLAGPAPESKPDAEFLTSQSGEFGTAAGLIYDIRAKGSRIVRAHERIARWRR